MNIMVRGDEITSINDRETAGWMPPYWEYDPAMNVNPRNQFWQQEIDKFICPDPQALHIENIRQRVFEESGYDLNSLKQAPCRCFICIKFYLVEQDRQSDAVPLCGSHTTLQVAIPGSILPRHQSHYHAPMPHKLLLPKTCMSSPADLASSECFLRYS